MLKPRNLPPEMLTVNPVAASLKKPTTGKEAFTVLLAVASTTLNGEGARATASSI